MNFVKNNFLKISSGISISVGTYYYFNRTPNTHIRKSANQRNFLLLMKIMSMISLIL